MIHGVLLLAAALLVAPPSGSAAQATQVRVRVIDSSKGAIPGATCTLVAPAPAAARVITQTDAEGKAVFNGVAPGAYALRVELDGFAPFVRSEIVVTGGATVDVDAVLGPPMLTHSVSVAAPAKDDVGVAAGASTPLAIGRVAVQRLPVPTSSVTDVLPLVPGVVRSGTGELSFDGSSEEASALRLNGMTISDPASGAFRPVLPVDAVESVQVFLHPYTAEHGQFSSGLTEIDTRAGGDRWRFEVNDFLPDLRFVDGRIKGVAEDAPHLNLSGPLLGRRLFLSQSASYTFARRAVRGLASPYNETRTEGESSFTQLDFALRPGHSQRVTVGYFPERRDFVGLDLFRPQPVTPGIRQRDAMATLRDNSVVAGGLLTSSFSIARYETSVRSRGLRELTLTPTGETGNYFATREGSSSRVEFLEVYALPTRRLLGAAHDVKFGLDLNSTSSRLDYHARPVNIVHADGALAKRIEFDAVPAIRASNQELIAFAQDRWSLGRRLSVDLGMRLEDQRVADATLFSPRAGFAFTPSDDGSTVIRGGVGLFFDKVPLNIRSFAGYPARTVTRFAADGVTVVDSRVVTNVLVDAVDGRAMSVPGTASEFVPENLTWNVQVDRLFRPWLAARVNVVRSSSGNVYIVTPKGLPDGRQVIELSSTGSSKYRAVQVHGRVGPIGHAINVSYTRSRARGDLNTFAAAFGDLALPVIRANQYSQLPVDTPNRFLGWGTIALPRRVTLAPILEVRTGFPYSVVDANQNFVGVRNAENTRFPRFMALDMEMAKELQVTRKYAVRLSLRGFNLTNHFNPRDVHANTADPAFGRFTAPYRRYFAGGFDVIF